jgi:hypothetical protein
MSDAVEVLLSVDDQASAAVQKAASKVTSIDSTAKAAKPSVISLENAVRSAGDALGRIGDTLDVPELGRASSAIGGIAEQLQTAKEASEGMKLGFIGTAGVAGGVAASAFAIGKAIGDVVFQTAAWEEKLKSGLGIMQQLESRRGRMAQQSFQDQMSRLDATDAPDTAYIELIRDLKRESEGVARNLAAEMAKLDEMTSAYYTYVDTYSRQIAEANVSAFQAQLEQLKEQESQVERLLTVERELTKERERKSRAESEAKFIQQLQDELELITASADEQDRIIAARNAASIEGQAAIEMLLRSKRMAQDEVEKAVTKSEQAKRTLDKPKTSQDRMTQLDAFESRLLTRGPGQPLSEETKAIRELTKVVKDQQRFLESTSQDMSKLMRNRVVVSAPDGEAG